MQEFYIEVAACGPIASNYEKGDVVVNFEAGSSYKAYLNPQKCQCNCPDKDEKPPPPYDLTKCPVPSDQLKVFLWDCETNFEAKSYPEAQAHDRAVRKVSARDYLLSDPPWKQGCKKCICAIYLKIEIQGYEGEAGEGELYVWNIKQLNEEGYIGRVVGTYASSGASVTKNSPKLKASIREDGTVEDAIYISIDTDGSSKNDGDVNISITAIDWFSDKTLATFSGAGQHKIPCL